MSPSRGRPSRLQIAKPDIVKFFEDYPWRVFSRDNLAGILDEHREEWRLAKRTTVRDFADFLVEKTKLGRVEFGPPRKAARYCWGPPSVFELAISLATAGAYLSHATAVFLHDLTDQIPKVIYVNREQSPKPTSAGLLRQDAIDRAFARPQRTSNYFFTYGERRIVILSGKYTDRLEVESRTGPNEEPLDCTRLERTLIDIVVRPTYSGGIIQVLEAYRRARGRLSTNVLTATLKKLDYMYPYHQAIGFLMERAGYDAKSYDRLKSIGLEFDFYLVHGAKETAYDSSWRIHYPKGL